MSVNITNPPIDRRSLSAKDRADYNRSGGHSRAQKALARTRAYRGRQRQRRNTPMGSESRTPGTGGYGGLQIQQQRVRQIGNERRRAESFRPEISVPNNTQNPANRRQQMMYENYRNRRDAIN